MCYPMRGYVGLMGDSISYIELVIRIHDMMAVFNSTVIFY